MIFSSRTYKDIYVYARMPCLAYNYVHGSTAQLGGLKILEPIEPLSCVHCVTKIFSRIQQSSSTRHRVHSSMAQLAQLFCPPAAWASWVAHSVSYIICALSAAVLHSWASTNNNTANTASDKHRQPWHQLWSKLLLAEKFQSWSASKVWEINRRCCQHLNLL